MGRENSIIERNGVSQFTAIMLNIRFSKDCDYDLGDYAFFVGGVHKDQGSSVTQVDTNCGKIVPFETYESTRLEGTDLMFFEIMPEFTWVFKDEYYCTDFDAWTLGESLSFAVDCVWESENEQEVFDYAVKMWKGNMKWWGLK